MRNLTLAFIAITFLALTACGGGSGRKTEQTFPLEQAPTASNDAGLKATITHYKQSDHYLIVNLSLTNNGKEAIMLKNGDGQTMPGFRTTIDGQTFIADRKTGGSWNPWTGYHAGNGPTGGSNNLEIPAGITATIELRWNFQVSRKDYDWVVTVSNIQVGEKKVGDIALAYPPASAPMPAAK